MNNNNNNDAFTLHFIITCKDKYCFRYIEVIIIK